MTSGVIRVPKIGWFGAAFSTQGLIRLTLPVPEADQAWDELGVRGWRGHPTALDLLTKLADELEEYLVGELRSFTVPLDVGHHTPFRRSVWAVDRQIPYGQTRSYGWIARKIEKPHAARAVGGALAANPIPIIIPCHRVVRKDGSLAGYAGGTQMKADLLALERGQPRLFWP